MSIQIFFQLLLASALGALIGLEREWRKKEAGIRTFSLICLGACLFGIAGLHLIEAYKFSESAALRLDLIGIIQAVALGIGFIGAGVIFFKEKHIEGLTTAAGLWSTAAIGLLIAFEQYLLAIVAAILVIIIFAWLGHIEGELEKRFLKKEKEKKKSKEEENITQ